MGFGRLINCVVQSMFCFHERRAVLRILNRTPPSIGKRPHCTHVRWYKATHDCTGPCSKEQLSALPPLYPPSRYPPTTLPFALAMDAFTTILSILAPAAEVPRPEDAPVDSESTKSSNGGGCTVARKPVVDAPVDAESTKSSNGGGCTVA